VQPDAVPGYGAVFNAGVLRHDGRFHLFARGVREGYQRNHGPGPRFLDYISDILVFGSRDGVNYEFEYVLASASPDEVFCYEDPRVQRVHSNGVEHVMMTYTNLPNPALGQPWRIGIHRLIYTDGRFELNRSSGRTIGPDGHENKDAVVFNLSDGRVALIHRLHPNMQLALFDSLEELFEGGPEYWGAHLAELDAHTIVRPSSNALSVGAGAPPVHTEWGLLLFFHERIADGTYAMKVALLDHATGRAIAQLADPVLLPELPWEREGDVNNVIFVVGAHRLDDGAIYLTYGAADRAVGAAIVHELELMQALGIVAVEPSLETGRLL
jgi:predicted GH43/DUF377 family glycosyl hydrolase